MFFNKQPARSIWMLASSLARRAHSDSLLRNSIYIMATWVATALLGYIYWIVAARTYSAHDVGLAAALISVMTLAAAFANMGISFTLIQTLPRRESGYDWSLTLNAGLVAGTLTGLLAGAVVVMALPLFSSQFSIVGRSTEYILALVIGVPLMTVSTLLDQTFVAERAASNMLLRNVAYSVFKILLLGLPLVLIVHRDALGIFSSWVLACGVAVIGGGLLLIPRLGRSYYPAVRGILGRLRSMLSSLVGHYFIMLGGLTPLYLLPVFVATRLSATENAYFYTTTMLGGFFFMASSALAVSLFAEGSHAANDLSRKVRSCSMIIGVLLIPAMLVCYFGGGYILLVFGPSYAKHGLLLLRILVIAAVPDAITNIYVSVLRVQRRLTRAVVLNLGMATLDLSLAWILLPKQGIVGAGWSFLIAQSIGSLVAGVDLISFYRHRRSIGRSAMQTNTGFIKTGDSSRMAEEPTSGG